jgi:hypothetical protein
MNKENGRIMTPEEIGRLVATVQAVRTNEGRDELLRKHQSEISRIRRELPALEAMLTAIMTHPDSAGYGDDYFASTITEILQLCDSTSLAALLLVERVRTRMATEETIGTASLGETIPPTFV